MSVILAKRQPGGHLFGGSHTDDKTARVGDYLPAFNIALKKQGFRRVYIEGCAGSGERTQTWPAMPLLDGEAAALQAVSVPGSARLAIQATPPFDRYYFIEKDENHCAALQHVAADFPDRSIECHCADANVLIQRICRETQWRGRVGIRGVAFLDPYGMQIGWETVEAIARTRAIDCWYFFPLMGLYRQAANSAPDINERKQERLNWVLGTSEWRRAWYSTPHGPFDLFGDPAEAIRIADVDAIERFVKTRLESVFKGGVLEPLRYRGARGHPVGSLFFAISNPHAALLASRIASSVLRRPWSTHQPPNPTFPGLAGGL
jgi:three-Cys-motif partner protein